MNDGWSHATLGEVAAIEMGQSPPGSSYNNVGLGLPFLQGSAEFGPRYPEPVRWCDEPRKVARPGDILVSIRAPVGDLNRANKSLAVGRGLALVRSASAGVETDYLALALEQAAPEMRRRSGGTMFESINGKSLASQAILMPPLADQRRIVDLVTAADHALAAALQQLQSLRQSHSAIREELLAKADRAIRLGDLILRIDAGRSPDAEDRPPLDGESAVLKVSAVRPGWFDRTQLKGVDDVSVFPAEALLRNGDLLITRANGNRDLLGVVCIAEEVPSRCFLSDKTLRIVPDERAASPVFLMEALMSADTRRQIGLSGTGSASMKNISQTSIRTLTVPLLPASEQAVLVAVTDGFRAATRRTEIEVVALSELRSALLADLLSGRHEIPASYDIFLDGVA